MGIFLSYYIAETADLLTARGEPDNPFITLLLPRAHADHLLMQVVVLLGGLHLSHQSHNFKLTSLTWSFYAQAIRGLKHKLTMLADDDEHTLLSLLCTTILLSQAEVSGLPDHETLFSFACV